MKNFNLCILALAAATFFFSCKKENDFEPKSPEASIQNEKTQYLKQDIGGKVMASARLIQPQKLSATEVEKLGLQYSGERLIPIKPIRPIFPLIRCFQSQTEYYQTLWNVPTPTAPCGSIESDKRAATILFSDGTSIVVDSTVINTQWGSYTGYGGFATQPSCQPHYLPTLGNISIRYYAANGGQTHSVRWAYDCSISQNLKPILFFRGLRIYVAYFNDVTLWYPDGLGGALQKEMVAIL